MWMQLFEREERERRRAAEPRSRIHELLGTPLPMQVEIGHDFSWRDAEEALSAYNPFRLEGEVRIIDPLAIKWTGCPSPQAPQPLEDLTGDNREEL